MKSILLLAALAVMAGCSPFNPEGLKAEFANADGSRPVNKAVFKQAFKLCDERFRGRYQTEQALYGPNGDWVGLLDDAKACMERHGVQVLGWRQRDGRLTAYPIYPKYFDY